MMYSYDSTDINVNNLKGNYKTNGEETYIKMGCWNTQ